jgi:tRNA pseudouridine13 synthase
MASQFVPAILNRHLMILGWYGVPNYFGEQRFGIEAGNLTLAQDWFVSGKKIKNRNLKGMVLSAARSYIFNLVLSERIKQENWNTVIPGDILGQISKGDSPTGPLWGRGRNAASEDAVTIEDKITRQFEVWCDGLEHQGLSQERRNLVCVPKDLTWQFCDNHLTLEFSLLPGEYATSVMREIAHLI